MTWAALAAILAALGYVFGLKRKSARERDARVHAEIQRDQERGRAETAEAERKVDAEVHAKQTEGRAAERTVEAAAAQATAAGDPHPERAAARERQRQAEAAAKVRRLTGRAK